MEKVAGISVKISAAARKETIRDVAAQGECAEITTWVEFTNVHDADSIPDGMVAFEYDGDQYIKFKYAGAAGQELYAISICIVTPRSRFKGT